MIEKLNRSIKETQWVPKIAWISFFAAVLFVLSTSIFLHKNANVASINIELFSSAEGRKLVSKKDINTKVLAYLDKDLKNVQLMDLDVYGLEKHLSKDERLKNCEVYIDAKNRLHVLAELREPIVRVVADNGQDYYLDEEGFVIKTLKNKAVRVPVATGDIDEFKKDWKKNPKHDLNKILELANAIQKDNFFRALCEQINIDKNGDLTIMPKLGKELVIGSMDDLDIKLRNIKGTYRKVLGTENWNTLKKFNFSTINQYRVVS